MSNNADRIGRSFRLGKFEKFDHEVGYTDKDNIKSIYMFLKTTVVCTEEDDYMFHLKNLHHQVKQSIHRNINKSLVKPLFISTPVIRNSFDWTGKSFTQFDYTFFVEPNTDWKVLKNFFADLLVKINQEVFEPSTSFIFHNNNWKLTRLKQLQNVKDKGKHFSKDILWEETQGGEKIF